MPLNLWYYLFPLTQKIHMSFISTEGSAEGMNKFLDYDSISAKYDEVRVGDPAMVQQLMCGMGATPSQRVLDIGCGTANNTLLFADASGTVITGLDLSFGMLCKASIKAPHLPFIQASADDIPFIDSSFDFAFMTEVAHLLPNLRRTIAEIHRILTSDGMMCIVTQSHKQIEERTTSRFFPTTVTIEKERYPSLSSLERDLLDVGFSSIHADTFQFAPVLAGRDFLETVRHRGFSMLHRISDVEYAKGLSDLEAAIQSNTLIDSPLGYSFVWASKNPTSTS